MCATELLHEDGERGNEGECQKSHRQTNRRTRAKIRCSWVCMAVLSRVIDKNSKIFGLEQHCIVYKRSLAEKCTRVFGNDLRWYATEGAGFAQCFLELFQNVHHLFIYSRTLWFSFWIGSFNILISFVFYSCISTQITYYDSTYVICD